MKRLVCNQPGCERSPSRGLSTCSPCLLVMKRALFPNATHLEMYAALDNASRSRALTDQESLLLELAVRQIMPPRPVRHGIKGRPPKTDPRDREPIENQREDKMAMLHAEMASRHLLKAMLALGAKSGGCLSLSAAQCRARLALI